MTQRDESDSPVGRTCCGCGRTAPGLWPPGWRVTPVHGSAAGILGVVVGERAYCPKCQARTAVTL